MQACALSFAVDYAVEPSRYLHQRPKEPAKLGFDEVQEFLKELNQGPSLRSGDEEEFVEF